MSPTNEEGWLASRGLGESVESRPASITSYCAVMGKRAGYSVWVREVPTVSDSLLNAHARVHPHGTNSTSKGMRYFRRRRPLPNYPIHAICHAIDAIAAKNSQDLAQRPSIG